MASVTVTIAAGGEAGAVFRKIGQAIEQAAGDLADRNASGASAVLTIDNAAGSHCSVAVSGAGLTTRTVLV